MNDESEPAPVTAPEIPGDVVKKKKKKKKVKSTLPERDIQTWFRLTSRNLYTRRQQLDAKANILLSVNAVMLTLAAGTVYPSIDGHVPLLIAMLPVSLANLIAMFLCVRAMRPHIPLRGGTFEDWEVQNNEMRLTTFDYYYRMPEDSYVTAVEDLLKSQDSIHTSLINDIYELGILLARRYALLDLAYRIFMIGVFSSTLLFTFVEILVARGGAS